MGTRKQVRFECELPSLLRDEGVSELVWQPEYFSFFDWNLISCLFSDCTKLHTQQWIKDQQLFGVFTWRQMEENSCCDVMLCSLGLICQVAVFLIGRCVSQSSSHQKCKCVLFWLVDTRPQQQQSGLLILNYRLNENTSRVSVRNPTAFWRDRLKPAVWVWLSPPSVSYWSQEILIWAKRA